jgi:hypothetical protein
MSGPKTETPSPAPQGQPPTSGSASQATAAVSNAVSIVRQRLVAGEQLVLVAAAVIVVVVYLLFQFLLDYRFIVSDFTVVMAVLTILAIWIHRWGHHDFGNGYRILIGALGLSLALFAVINLLAWVRGGGGSGDFLELIGRIIFWISGIAAGYGAWLVFRLREA